MGQRMTDIGGEISQQKGTEALNQTAATVNGSGFDRTINQFQSCVLSVQAGAATGAPSAQTVDAKLQDSPDNSAWSDITDAAITQITADDQLEKVDVNLEAADKWIRTVLTVGFTGGTAPAVPVAPLMTFGGGAREPVA